jgi:hypothetical protein
MVAVTSAILGAAALGFGAYNAIEGRNQQREGLQQQQYALEQQRQATLQQQAGYRIQEQGAGLQYQLNLEQSQASRDYAQQNYNLNSNAAAQYRQYAGQSSDINKGIIDTQFQMEAERQKAMELDAKRQQREIIRNQQRARSIALASATAQGARFGSGLQGGYGQISGQSNVNALGIQQNLDIGRNMFNLNSQLANQRKQSIDLETQYAYSRADQQTQQAQMLYNYALTNAGFQDRSADIQTNYFSRGQGIINAASGQYQMGQGMYNMGQGTIQSGQSQTQFGGSLMQLGMNLPTLGQTLNNNYQSLSSMFSSSTPTATLSGFSSPTDRYDTGRYSNYGYGS